MTFVNDITREMGACLLKVFLYTHFDAYMKLLVNFMHSNENDDTVIYIIYYYSQ